MIDPKAHEEEVASLKDVITRIWWRVDACLDEFKRLLKAPMSTNATDSTGTSAGRGDSSNCTDNSVSGRDSSHVNNVRIEVGDRTWSVIAILLSALAIGLAILAIVLAQLAERETKLAREDIRVMSIALAHHGINTDEHATEKGETK